MGGGLSLALASHANKIGKPIQVAIPCYGTSPASFDITNLKDTAVQGHFGGKVMYTSRNLKNKFF